MSEYNLIRNIADFNILFGGGMHSAGFHSSFDFNYPGLIIIIGLK